MKTKVISRLKKSFLFLCIIVVIGFCLPSSLIIPVEGATKDNWDYRSYWYYPWGKSITHKGIDIFAPKQTNVIAPTYGIIVKVGNSTNGGNFVYLLGPDWHVHYFAHLDTISTGRYSLIKKGDILGKVGNTGNASGKESHLHYSISALIPYPWLYDEFAEQGWLKMIYLNPEDFF
jgi:murein DD-endopeptidase MepM/ murein hydrolase activator NlpD